MAEERLVSLKVEPFVFEALGVAALAAIIYGLGYYRGDKHARSGHNQKGIS